MRGVAHQYQIAAIESGNQVNIQGPPEMRAGKICNAENMRYRRSPVIHKSLHKFLSRLGKVLRIFRRRRKPLTIKLDVPDHIFGVHGKNAKSNSAAGGMEFV